MTKLNVTILSFLGLIFHINFNEIVAFVQPSITQVQIGYSTHPSQSLNASASPSDSSLDTLENAGSISGTAPAAPVENSSSRRRRSVLGMIGSVSAASAAAAKSTKQASAAVPVDAGEAVRRSAANIPGYGPTDVFYPADWLGTWKVRREVVVTGASSPEPIILEYMMRFLPSVQDNAVVADRGYNQANLEAAIRKQLTSEAIRSYKWTETNPNDLSIVFADGARKDIKVTKRASDNDVGQGMVSSSEFQRVSQDDSRGIPVITARRILTKWKPTAQSERKTTRIEGLELVYDVGGGGDPMSFGTASSQQSPKVLSKSKLFLERVE